MTITKVFSKQYPSLHKSEDASLNKVDSKSSCMPMSMSSSQGIKPLCLIAPSALPWSRTYPIPCLSKTTYFFCFRFIESTSIALLITLLLD